MKIAVRWIDEDRFIAGSYDHSASIWRLTTADGTDRLSFVQIKELLFTGTVEAIEILPRLHMLAISIRDDNYLHVVDTSTESFSVCVCLLFFRK